MLRDPTNGIIKCWADGVKIFDISGLSTKYEPTAYPNGEPYTCDVARTYCGESVGEKWLFVDNLPIWNVLPSA